MPPHVCVSQICRAVHRNVLTAWCCPGQGSGKDLIQPVLDNQLKAISPLVIPEGVRCHVARIHHLPAAPWLHLHRGSLAAGLHACNQLTITIRRCRLTSSAPVHSAATAELVHPVSCRTGSRSCRWRRRWIWSRTPSWRLASGTSTRCARPHLQPLRRVKPHACPTPDGRAEIGLADACACVAAKGDAVEILIVTKDGVRREEMPLKKD